MQPEAMPSVSIGMPVFNGENYLREALESFANQAFEDYELIISDNASTDTTESICREFAERDHRIRYFRAEKNHGASWNHDFVINESRAPYFKLAAHDDVCLPTHLEKCIEALDNHPQAVLAYTQTFMMHGDQNSMTLYEDEVELTSPVAAIRYGDLIHEAPPAFPIFGVVRLSALKSIPLFEPYKASDRVVLTRLALLGPFVEIDEPLFQYRWHDDNASHLMETPEKFYSWWHPGKGTKKVYPECRLMWEHLRSVFLPGLNWTTRRQCLREWWHWVMTKRLIMLEELGQLINRPAPRMQPTHLFAKLIARQQRSQYKARYYPNAAIKNESVSS